MASFDKCLKRVRGLKDADLSRVMDRLDMMDDKGQPSQKAAVRAVIKALREEKAQIAQAAIDQHPELFPDEAPKSKPVEVERPPEPKITSTGKIVGAPPEAPTVADRRKIIRGMLKTLDHPFAMAETSPYWFEESGKLIREAARNNPAQMERLVRMYALSSKGATVESNQSFVINAATLAERKNKFMLGKYPKQLEPVIKKLLDPNVPFDESLKGEFVSDKVINFYRNLHDAAFQNDQYASALTLDRWMMRSAGFDYRSDDNANGRMGRANLSDAQYVYLHDLLMRVTDAYNEEHGTKFLPKHIQSMLWTYERNKASYEAIKDNILAAKVAIDIYKGAQTARAEKAPDPVLDMAIKRLERRYAGVDSEQSYIAKQEERLKNFKPRSISFLTDFARVEAYVAGNTNPAIPMEGLSRDQQSAVHTLANEIITDSNGDDVILKKLKGSPIYFWHQTVTGNSGEVSPSRITRVALPTAMPTMGNIEGMNLTEDQRRELDAMARRQAVTGRETSMADSYAAMWGIIFNQPQVSWFMKAPKGAPLKDTSVAVVVGMERSIPRLMAEQLYKHVTKVAPELNAHFVAMDDRLVFANLSKSVPDEKFTKGITEAIASFEGTVDMLGAEDLNLTYDTHRVVGTILEGGKDGENYALTLKQAGVPDDTARWAYRARENFARAAATLGASTELPATPRPTKPSEVRHEIPQLGEVFVKPGESGYSAMSRRIREYANAEMPTVLGGTAEEQAMLDTAVTTIGHYWGKLGNFSLVTPGYRLDVESRDLTGRSADAELADRVAAMFGKKIIWYAADDTGALSDRSGFYIRGEESLKDVVFLKANSKNAFHQLLGHELLHSIANTDPELYTSLRIAVRSMLKSRKEYAERYGMELKYDESGSYNRQQLAMVEEEMIADLLGTSLSDPRFWSKLQEHSPGLFDKLVAKVWDFLTKVWNTIMGQKNAEAIVPTDLQIVATKDLNKVHGALASALAEYRARTHSGKGWSVGPALKISGWHGGGVTDIKQFSLNFVNSGEGAQVYSWGLYFADLQSTADWYVKTVGKKAGEWVVVHKGNQVTPWNDINDGLTAMVESAKVFGDVTDQELAQFAATVMKQYKEGNVFDGSSIGDMTDIMSYIESLFWERDPNTSMDSVMSDDDLAAFLGNERPLGNRGERSTEEAWRILQSSFDQFRTTAKNHTQVASKAALYQVEINSDPEHFMFWDRPDQTEYVKNHLGPTIQAMSSKEGRTRLMNGAMKVIANAYERARREINSALATAKSEGRDTEIEIIQENLREIDAERKAASQALYDNKPGDMLMAMKGLSRQLQDTENEPYRYFMEDVQATLELLANRKSFTINGLTGEQIYSLFETMHGSPRDASLAINKLGVAGMRYIDGFTRHDDDQSKWTYNWVLYDDKLVKIVQNTQKTVVWKADAIDQIGAAGASAMDGQMSNIRDHLKEAVEIAKGKKLDLLPLALQVLGRRQIAEIYSDLIPELQAYSDRVQRMDAEANEMGYEADKLVTRWGKLPQAVADSLADLMHDATLAQVEADPENKVGGTNFGIWPDKKALAEKIDELQGRFNALPKEAQAIYREARDLYRAQWEKAREAMVERIMRSIADDRTKKAAMDMIKLKFEESLRGVYFPLGRYGQYYIVVDKVGDDSGEHAAVVFAETKSEADRERTRMLAEFGKGYTVSNVQFRYDRMDYQSGASAEFVAKLYEAIDTQKLGKDTTDALKDAVHQLYLSSMPDVSWAKHGIHRKGTYGYSKDARRNFASNLFHGGFYTARLDHMDQLQAGLRDMEGGIRARALDPDYDSAKAGIVLNEMLHRHERLTKVENSPVSNMLTGLGFIWQMGVSPASALVNLSQTALVAFPILSARFGLVSSFNALTKSSFELAKAINITDPANLFGIEKAYKDDPKLLAAIQRGIKEGVIDLTMAHDLAGVAEGRDRQFSSRFSPMMKTASWMFHQAELFNRLSTFVAAYRMAEESRDANPYDTAVKMTYDSHFDYAQSNRARVMQGPVAKVILLFKQYGQNMIYLLARNAYLATKGNPEAAKRLGYTLGMTALATGTFGLPWVISGGLMALAEALIGSDDDPWDAETWIRNALAEEFGPEVSEAVTKGAWRMLPVVGRADIASRVGLDTMLFRGNDMQLSGADWYHSMADSILGPVAGVALNVAKGSAELQKGDWQRGLEQMLPVAIANPLKAYRYAKEGVIDRSGVEIMAEVDGIDEMMQAIGFTPSRVREHFDARRYVYGYDKAVMERRKDLLRRFSMGVTKGDEGAVETVMADIQRFNETQPTVKITGETLKSSVQNRMKRIAEAEQGIYLPKPRRGLVERAGFLEE